MKHLMHVCTIMYNRPELAKAKFNYVIRTSSINKCEALVNVYISSYQFWSMYMYLL